MHWFNVLLVRSLAPSVCGWYAVDIFRCTPVNVCNAFQNFEMNSLSRSEMSSRGKPFSQYHSLKKIEARCEAEISVLVGIRQTSEPNLSVTVRTQLYPSSSGRGPTKSRQTESPRFSGTGKGWSGPLGFEVPLLFHWQLGQAGIYAFSRSLHIFGQ
jgi:hypothetical protein